MKQTFEEKVRAMSAKEIIMAMVEGLRNPVVKVNMYTFGESHIDGTCYGCAATNAICKISGLVFTNNSIGSMAYRSRYIGCDFDFLDCFESAIDSLRCGNLDYYNECADVINIAKILNPNNIYLPVLDNYYTPEQLDIYVQLANDQEKQ